MKDLHKDFKLNDYSWFHKVFSFFCHIFINEIVTLSDDDYEKIVNLQYILI